MQSGLQLLQTKDVEDVTVNKYKIKIWLANSSDILVLKLVSVRFLVKKISSYSNSVLTVILVFI